MVPLEGSVPKIFEKMLEMGKQERNFKVGNIAIVNQANVLRNHWYKTTVIGVNSDKKRLVES